MTTLAPLARKTAPAGGAVNQVDNESNSSNASRMLRDVDDAPTSANTAAPGEKEPSKKKTKFNGRKGQPYRYPWDESESELLMALRAKGLAFSKIQAQHFPQWSVIGMTYKFHRLTREEPRLMARYEEIRGMTDAQKLALIVIAEAAVARARSQRESRDRVPDIPDTEVARTAEPEEQAPMGLVEDFDDQEVGDRVESKEE